MDDKMQRNIRQLRQDRLFCDVTLRGKTGEFEEGSSKEIHAHRLILASSSDYFKAMFTLDMIESRTGEVIIENATHETLQQIIDYCYTGSISLSPDTIEDILTTANFLGIAKIESKCVEFLGNNITATNVYAIGGLAERFAYLGLAKQTHEYALQNFEVCSKSADFLQLPFEKISKLVDNDDFNISREEDAYNAVTRWVRFDKPKRQIHLNELLKHVHFHMLDRTFLMKEVVKERMIVDDADMRQFLYKALDYHMSSKNTRTVSPLNRSRRWKQEHRIFFVGGKSENGVERSVNLYHPKEQLWEVRCTLNVGRSHPAAVLVDAVLYCLGGVDCEDVELRSVEKYDCYKDKWSSEVPLKNCKGMLQAVQLGGQVYVLGGSEGDQALNYMEKSNFGIINGWLQLPHMPTARRNFAAVVFDDTICTIAGHTGKRITEQCQLFDPVSGQWSPMAPLNKPRMDHAAVRMGEDKLFVYGGRNEAGCLDCVEKYNRALDMWLIVKHTFKPTTGSSLVFMGNPKSTDRKKGVKYKDALLLVGGLNDAGNYEHGMEQIRLDSIDYEIEERKPLTKGVAFAGVCIV